MRHMRIVAMLLAVSFIMAAFGTAAMAAGMTVVTTASVNLRRGAGVGYGRITAVSKNSRYDYTGRSAYDERGVAWHRLKYGSGYAWVSSRYSNVVIDGVTLNDDACVITTASVNLRSGAGTGYSRLSTAARGTKLFYLGMAARDSSGRIWYRVSCSQGPAWVSSRYAVLGSQTPSYESSSDYVTTTASVNLRKGPGLGYGVIVALSKGRRLEYMGQSSTDSRGVVWYKVSYNGSEAWISSRYSKLYR